MAAGRGEREERKRKRKREREGGRGERRKGGGGKQLEIWQRQTTDHSQTSVLRCFARVLLHSFESLLGKEEWGLGVTLGDAQVSLPAAVQEIKPEFPGHSVCAQHIEICLSVSLLTLQA